MAGPIADQYKFRNDEDNMKFIISRDVIFLEFEKYALTIDKQLAQLDRFHSKKSIMKWIMNFQILKGGFLF